MTRIQHSRDFWVDEVKYITHAWPDEKASFRNDESVFNEYIEMQAEFCEKDGYPDLAFHMREFL